MSYCEHQTENEETLTHRVVCGCRYLQLLKCGEF